MIAFPASLLILNGKSADNLPLRDAIAKLRDEGVEIHVRVTWEKGDAQRYVDEARQLGVETVIAGGGDGTINEVSTALIQSQGDNIPALGILPLGTANDFATSVGIPDDLDKALKLAIAANATAIDMVQVNDKTCFINMATGDFGTYHYRNAGKTQSCVGWCIILYPRINAHGYAQTRRLRYSWGRFSLAR